MKTWFAGLYKGTVVSFALATVLGTFMLILELQNKVVPSYFSYPFVALTGVGSAITASGIGGNSGQPNSQP